jgi:hypothetical protein
MNRRAAFLLVVTVATALYLPSVRNGFAYDDVAIIERDTRVHSLRSLPELLTASYWNDDELGLYRPLVSASYALDWAVSGGRAGWFHLVNTVWNAIACGVLFLLLACLAPVGAALAGALLFAAHPVHVEAVANVVGRAELMAAVFGLSALLVWARRAPAEPVRRGGLAIAALSFALALLSKESAIMLPALILLVDGARGELTSGTARTWLRRNGVAFTLLVSVAVGYLVLRTAVLGDLGPGRLDPALEVGTPWQQRLTALQIWPVVLRVLLFPTVLLADYSPRILLPAMPVTTGALLGAVFLFGMLAGGVLAFLRGNGRVALALLWLPAALLPASSLVIPIGVLVAERALYLPSAAIAFALTFGLAAVRAPRSRRIAVAAVVAAFAAFAARSLVRIPEWRTTDTIFAALMRDRPDAFRAHWHSARIALRDRQPGLALERYGRALQLWPYRRQLVLEAATQAALHGDRDYARRLSTYMLQRWPGDLDASRMLAGAALDVGDTTVARVTIDHALRLHPGDTLLLRMRAAIPKDSTS